MTYFLIAALALVTLWMIVEICALANRIERFENLAHVDRPVRVQSIRTTTLVDFDARTQGRI